MMNEETPHGQSPKKPSRSRPQTAEDLDFEILDALENIGNAGSIAEPASHADDFSDDAFELDLDDDVMFDEEKVGETEEFSLNDDTDSSRLAGEADDYGTNTDIANGIQINENDDGSFSLDLDEDSDELDLSFDDDIDLDLDDDLGNSALAPSPALDEDDFSMSTEISSDLDLGVFSAPSIDMQDDASEPDDNEEESLPPEFDIDQSFSLDDDEFAMPNEEFSEERDESFDDDDDDDIDIDNMPDLDETMAEFTSALTRDTSAFNSDDNQSDLELEYMKKEEEIEGFPGKNIISINGEDVVDLGDEDDIGSIADVDSASWNGDDDLYSDDDFLDDADATYGDDDDDDAELAELAEEAQAIADNVIQDNIEGQDTNFMASLDNIHIDLHDDDADDDDLETFGSDDDDFDLPEDAATSDEEDFEEEFDIPNLSDAFTHVHEDTGIEEGIDVEPSPEKEPEIDVREALGLVPRLVDEEIRKFDQMVSDAKILQQYIEELEEHQPEIKSPIYYKLLKEYTERKADIFREPEFIGIRIDVEQDLEDMLRKRDQVQRTVSGLHDELEEAQVRHLVGEYSDEELARQETSRKAEIDAWQQKTDHLEQFIAHYRELLETENALNPIEDDEAEPEPDTTSEASSLLNDAEANVDTAENERFHELESPDSQDDDLPEAPEELSSMTEEVGDIDESALDDESGGMDEIVPVQDDADDDADDDVDDSVDEFSDELAGIGDLTGILDDDESPDWDDEEDEDLELTAESFDDDFSLDDDFSDDEELTGLDGDAFELDGLTEADDDDTPVALDFEDADDDGGDEPGGPEEAMVSCKKCGRSTPASEKFCANCGAKAR